MVYAQVEDVTKTISGIDITLADGKTLHTPGNLFAKVRARMAADRSTRSARSFLGPDETLPGPCGFSYMSIGFQDTEVTTGRSRSCLFHTFLARTWTI
ncbi:hypothetical protein [Streptomyces sp. MBT62]|uniref:hypothetical protein n=1 Tax=Streptomyces sp. MBT62 TaxID=2800410 RepID=UPI001909A46D|nr:hypothetical protein [Streptomyces sp. MBT62]MBK3562957.1 hypothetical protein [Streptomyces sp. MBT62]